MKPVFEKENYGMEGLFCQKAITSAISWSVKK